MFDFLIRSHSIYYAFAVLVFIATVLAIEGVYMWWNDVRGPEAKRIERRLRILSAGGHGKQRNASILKQRLLSSSPRVQQLLVRIPRVRQLDRLLEQSGGAWSVAQFVFLSTVFSVGALALMVVMRQPMLTALAVGAAAGFGPFAWVLRGKHKRLLKIDEQLPDALDLMARALRSGYAFPSTLKMVGEEMTDPIAGEFSTAFDEVNFGISMSDALMNLATRVASTHVRYFVVAVLIQRDTGGNLSELLDNIAAVIRARHRLLGSIRTLSAEGRLSAWILCLLPFGLAFVLYLANPTFLSLLWTDPKGVQIVTVAAVLMALGVVWIRSITHFHI